MQDLLQQAAGILSQARRLVVLTGAGISKESGIPTFREAQQGLWAQYDPQRLATMQGFLTNPSLVWDWYQFRLGLVEQAQPNPGHRAIVELEQRLPHVEVITQNVDGLHVQAGIRRTFVYIALLNPQLCNYEDVPYASFQKDTDTFQEHNTFLFQGSC